MSRHTLPLVQQLNASLARFETEQFPLPGIRNPQNRAVFIKQVIDSIRRVQYVPTVESRPLSPDRADPFSALFDPIKAALIHKSVGEFDEACWLVFLSVHFGKHRRAGWRYTREVYGKLGRQPYWTWSATAASPTRFRTWLRNNQQELLRGSNRGFGNHRKYQSMDADSPAGTGAAIQSYVTWVMRFGGHSQLFQHALNQAGGNSKLAFEWLYKSMDDVVSFGRMAKFDYLTMLGKTGLAQIEPGIPYLKGATGPLPGARLMLQGSLANEHSIPVLETRLVTLGEYLGVGMQVIEDSLCNWQKSPSQYKLFAG